MGHQTCTKGPFIISSINDTTLARATAAIASAGAGFIHLAVYPTHLEEWPPSGLFFAGIAAFQIAWASAVAFSDRRYLLILGMLANTGSLGMWAVSRTWGVPVGPDAGTAEPVGLPDTLTVVLEITVLAAALWSLLRRPGRSLSRVGYGSAIGGIALAAVTMTAPGVLVAFDHDHAPGEEHGAADAEERPNADPRDQGSQPDPTVSPSSKTRSDRKPGRKARRHDDPGHTH